MKLNPTLLKSVKLAVAHHNRQAASVAQDKSIALVRAYEKKHATQVRKLIAENQAARKQLEATTRELKNLGYSTYFQNQTPVWELNSQMRQKVSAVPVGTVNESEILRELAAASPVKATAILKRIGIDWSH